MSQETNKENKQLSPEEIEKQRKAVVTYYTNQIEMLKVQSEYESLLADIEEHRARRVANIIRQAQMTAGPESEPSEENNEVEPNEEELQEIPTESPKKERKLKTV